MNLHNVEFFISAARNTDFPKTRLPEIAFAGKSNVGKSSVINRLLNRKNFARVGEKPGKTIHVNYFTIDKMCYFVDLPGYGYAKVSEAEKKKWGEMIENYLNNSKMLRIVFLLIDIRHRPSANDKQMFEWIEYMGFDPVIIATKSDKIKRSQIDKHIKQVREGLGASSDTIIVPFSSQTKAGRDIILDFCDQVLENEDIKRD